MNFIQAYLDWWVKRIGAKNVFMMIILKWFILGVLLGLML